MSEENKEVLILDLESALRISIVVQNGAIGVQWRDDSLTEIYDQRLFSQPSDVTLFIGELLEKYLNDEIVTPQD